MNLPKAARLRRRREFLEVQARGTRLHAGDVVVLALPGEGRLPRIGITVSSRIGNAVVRNRVRRWMREAFRAEQSGWPPVDLLVIARSSAPAIGLEGVRRALSAARARLSEIAVAPSEGGRRAVRRRGTGRGGGGGR